MMKIGVASSPGLAIGKVYILDEAEINIDKSNIESSEVQVEIQRLAKAFEDSRSQIEEIYQKALQTVGEDEANIIQAHLMIVDDPVLLDGVKDSITNELFKAEYALNKNVEEQVELFKQIDDPYIKERAADIKDVGSRLLKNMLGIPIKDISNMKEDVIIAGKEITPSLMATVDRKHVKGIIAETGGSTAHTAILARNMDIPAILGAKGILSLLKEGQLISMDGSKAVIQLELDKGKIFEIEKKIELGKRIKEELSKLKNIQTRTLDGHVIELSANIGMPDDAQKAMENGAEGVGLFRTEFLYMDRDRQPNEEEQFASYKKAVEIMDGRPVIIRTLDVGGDKEIPYFKLPKEENPFLGYRAIRICLEDVELFKTQLRAILRASKFGNTLIMYPMIASAGEVARANEILEEAKNELRQRQQEFDEDIKIGIMVEIPSAAISADLIIKEVDFFSIGTNDLTQYTLAVDRGNEKVSPIYEGMHPSVLRLVRNVIEVSHGKNKFTGMCGELAGNPLATILLLGMGLDEFSMSPSSILKIKKIVNSVNISYAREVAQYVMTLSSAIEIENYMKSVLKGLELDYILEI